MRKLTQKLGKLLYRDGAMLVASMLFAGLYIQHMGSVAS